MAEKSESLNPEMTGEQLRQSWQGRALAWSALTSPKLYNVLMSVIADNYDEAFPFLLHATFGHTAVTAPFLCTSPRINQAGQITADLVTKYGILQKAFVIFDDEDQMQTIFRRLADKMKFTDAERIDLFIAVRFWVKADFRFDPTMDRRDPDAKRLTVH